jgi:chromosome segregation ATPase
MIRTEAEYKNAQERFEQEKETLQRQREELEEMDLSEEEVERALGPLISFRDQLREEIETYERMRGEIFRRFMTFEVSAGGSSAPGSQRDGH